MIDATITESSTVEMLPQGQSIEQPETPATPPTEQPEPAKEVSPQDALNKLSSDQYKEWLKTGDLPNADKAESAPATKQQAETESEAATDEPEAKGAEKRIKQLLKERHELRQELEQAKAQPKAAEPAPTQKASEAEPVEPKLEDFTTYDEYQKAERQYVRDMARLEARQELQQQREAEQKQKQEQTLATAWNDRVKAFKTEVPDFDDHVAASNIPGIERLAPLIVRSEVGPAIAHHLMLNPDIAESLTSVDALSMAKQFGRLEIQFEKPNQATAQTQRPTTKALPPPRKVTGAATPQDPLDEAIQKQDFSTYKRLMNERESRMGR